MSFSSFQVFLNVIPRQQNGNQSKNPRIPTEKPTQFAESRKGPNLGGFTKRRGVSFQVRSDKTFMESGVEAQL